MAERRRIAVVGAGISGLAAAHRLRSATACDVTVLDAAERAGGMVQTEHWQGFTIEHGPEGFLSSRPEALELVESVGLGDDLLTGGPAPRQTFVLRGGELRPLPYGILQPTRASARNLLTSPLLSLPGRARLALEPFVRRNRSPDDESVATFVRRRFGPELLDQLVEPLVGGVHGDGTDALSVDMVLPALRRIEREGGSVALRALRTPAPTARGGLPPLVTLRRGMGSLVDALARQLGSDLRLGVGVTGIDPSGGGWRLTLDDGDAIDADGVIVATPPAVTAKLVAPLDTELADLVEAQPMSRSQIVTLVWEPGAVDVELPGTGFLVPRSEGGQVAACTWVSAKWHHRAPEHGVAIRCFLRPGPDGFLAEDDAIDLVRSQLADVMGIDVAPTRALHATWSAAIPVMHVGHRLRTARIRELVAAQGSLALAGAGLEGGGLPGCIRSGTLAAESLL